MKKRCTTLLLAAGLVFTCLTEASAIDFKAEGEWFMGFGGVESTLVKDNNAGKDVFGAQQRLRLQLEAIASENLSGTVRFQIGELVWGNAESGGALGADEKVVGVLDAYIDWTVPNTDLRLRMGLQPITLPNVAGGSPILDDESAGIVASYAFTDNVGLTAFWLRPFNDNFLGKDNAAFRHNSTKAGYLDNIDYFGLSVPLKFDGIELTPWAMLGIMGYNSFDPKDADGEDVAGPAAGLTMPISWSNGINPRDFNTRSRGSYGTQFYAGLPIAITAFDPWNFEVDINYGYSSGFGKYSVENRLGDERRAGSSRQGWLIKGLAEYKMDWGTPGILAWYASGDDGNVKNGSERMPSISPSANFTSFMQDGDGWSIDGGYDKMLTFDGTWGAGIQIRDISVLENLSHTFRAVYWGGTNSASMIKYTDNPQTWSHDDGIYLTTLDYLVEFNLDTTYQIYENLAATLQLGYIVNGIDRDAWRRHSSEKSFQNSDAWKAALVFNYTF